MNSSSLLGPFNFETTDLARFIWSRGRHQTLRIHEVSTTNHYFWFLGVWHSYIPTEFRVVELADGTEGTLLQCAGKLRPENKVVRWDDGIETEYTPREFADQVRSLKHLAISPL